jgi:DNA-binding NtrC family response regulator
MRRILFVDDDALMLRAYRNVLRDFKGGIDMVETLEEARAHLTRNQYDVVVTDLRLTALVKREGLEILRIAKEMNPDTKVILVTAYGNHEVMNEAYRMGASFYMEKPMSPEAFRKALATLDAL